MDNAEVAGVLERIADPLDVVGENPFRTRAELPELIVFGLGMKRGRLLSSHAKTADELIVNTARSF